MKLFYIAIEIHIASFYLSNCEVKSQQSVLITVSPASPPSQSHRILLIARLALN
ncbi:hypothetical protein I79_007835 [Cricetulus griseus]|uniref:Uncharacterized protein n=1 Tax=Cricetulus griseus TaxID=10029 RepID=G3HBK2_CRIGR|nr:hypothetical protein I79_007835 [Cricetulus griseus]